MLFLVFLFLLLIAAFYPSFYRIAWIYIFLIYISPLFFLNFLLLFVLQKVLKYIISVSERGRLPNLIVIKFRLKLDLWSSVVEESISQIMERNMAVQVKKPGDKEFYYPKDQLALPEKERTGYLMEKLNRLDMCKKKDELIRFNKGTVNKLASSEVAYKLTLAQVCGWVQVLDGEAEIPFDKTKKVLMYDMIPSHHQDELEEVFGGNSLKVVEEEVETAKESDPA